MMHLTAFFHPAVLLAGVSLFTSLFLGLWLLSGRPWKERTLGLFFEGALLLELGLSLMTLIALQGGQRFQINLGPWLSVGHFHFDLALSLSWMDASYLVLAHLVLWTVQRFSSRYLAQEGGYARFILLLSFLELGNVLIASAAHLGLVIVGWELVGLASCLLIAFFVAHQAARSQSLLAFCSYRLADLGLLLAAVLLQPHMQTEEFVLIRPMGPLASGELIGLLIIVGTLAKAGQFPFISWMPRAMEGPTPSSAVFYGALSVHLAPLLLLRCEALWAPYPRLCWLLALIGGGTALLSTLIGATRSSSKPQLAYAVMSQIGLMYLSLALGGRTLVLIHMLGHALLRSAQFLNAASLIEEFHEGRYLPTAAKVGLVWRRLYLHAWNGFYWEALLQRSLFKLLGGSSRLAYGLVQTLRSRRKFAWKEPHLILKEEDL